MVVLHGGEGIRIQGRRLGGADTHLWTALTAGVSPP
jgi:hypothetical protein